jgi:hypothetical protein
MERKGVGDELSDEDAYSGERHHASGTRGSAKILDDWYLLFAARPEEMDEALWDATIDF